MRRLMAGAAAAALLAGGLGAAIPAAAATSASPAFTVKPPVWGACPSSYPDLIQAKAQCATLTVPLNYLHPNNGQITKIEISRILHTSKTHYQGVILSNPGGPGGTGLDLSFFLRGVLQGEGSAADNVAVSEYDWIGFDPRGVGASNAISCQPNYLAGPRRSYDPTTLSLLHYWLGRTRVYDKHCASNPKQLALLDHMTTADVARDMNSIRAALGQQKITYFGYSYGTYLGQVFSTLFSSHVRRIIMDSNVDPRNVWYQANLNQDIAFQRNVRIWFGWLAKYNSTYHLGRSVEAVRHRFNVTEAMLARHPVGGVVGPDEWTDIFLLAGYYQQTWLQLGQAFSQWANSHSAKAGTAIVNLYAGVDSPGNDSSFAAYNAVQCTDVQWPTNWAKWSRDNTRVNKIAPFETWANAWFNAPCLYWPAPASRKTPMSINGTHIKSALLIDETLDAATPFEGSLFVRTLFPHSVLLAEPGGTTHADSLSGNLCVDNVIAKYLAFGLLPPRVQHAAWDLTCKPLPVPVPPRHLSASSGPRAVPSLRQAQLAGLVG